MRSEGRTFGELGVAQRRSGHPPAMSLEEDRDHHFIGLLGSAVEAARIGALCVRVELDDGSSFEGVPEDTVLVQGEHESEIDESGVRADLVLGNTLVMLRQVRRFSVDRPAGRRVE